MDIRSLVAILVLLTSLVSASVSFPTPGFAGQFDDAVATYERGDYASAFRGMKPLAEKGDAKAQHNLGVMYDLGRGIPQDYTRAFHWYRKAAEQGFPEAQHNLGFMCYQGQGVSKDYVLAHMWLSLAASRYPPSVRKKIDDAVHYRDIVNSLMTPDQIAEAERLAREWKPKKEMK